MPEIKITGSRRMPHLIAIGGGIGSGKSIVCRVLRAMNYDVYDCDIRARIIVGNTPAIIEAIGREVCPEAIVRNTQGSLQINRSILADAVFSDKPKLQTLNSIVHTAVLEDIILWYNRRIEFDKCKPLFVESAIITESGIDKMVSQIWHVVAPDNIRINRIANRDGLNIEQIQQRINSQQNNLKSAHAPVFTIINDGSTPLLPQIDILLNQC